MKISAENDYRIKIELSDKDLQELDITYDELDYSNIETRRVLWTVLDCARKSLGRSIDLSGRMLIEAQPLGGGGCVLGFTMLSENSRAKSTEKLVKCTKNAAVFEVDNADALLDALSVCGETERTEIYEKNGCYRIVFNVGISEGQVARLCEFGEMRNAADLLCAYTREHWNRIEQSDECSSQ